MITHNEIAVYLLGRKLISANDIVNGTVRVEDASRRNHIFKVVRDRGASYLIKQGIGRQRILTLRHEASAYEALWAHSRRDGFARYLPRLYGYDPNKHLLILELLRGSQDLRDYHVVGGRTPPGIADAAGKVLATLHRAHRVNRRLRDQGFRRRLPVIFRLHRPELTTLRVISAGTIELIKILQEFKLGGFLDMLGKGWSLEAFIHGDLRWDNCIVGHQRSGGKVRLKIVDWEFAQFGDPCWDVASVFAEYLSFWLTLVPLTADSPPDQYLHLAEIPLERMQPAIRSFWTSYRRRMELSRAASDQHLFRAVQYAAAGLLQRALEVMEASAQLTTYVICLSQLSLNMFRQPDDASAKLLGIPFGA